jgi:hypothetical protein
MAQHLLVDFSRAYAVLDRLDQDATLPTIDTEALMEVLFETFIEQAGDASQIETTLGWIFSRTELAISESVSCAQSIKLWQLLHGVLLDMQAVMNGLDPYDQRCALWRYVRRHGANAALLSRVR